MVEVSKDTEEKISQLQLIEQNLQNFLLQRQQFMAQLTEIESALNELKDTQKSYKIIGNIMVDSSKEDLEEDLKKKKKHYWVKDKKPGKTRRNA